jgi:hypothetical protein
MCIYFLLRILTTIVKPRKQRIFKTRVCEFESAEAPFFLFLISVVFLFKKCSGQDLNLRLESNKCVYIFLLRMLTTIVKPRSAKGRIFKTRGCEFESAKAPFFHISNFYCIFILKMFWSRSEPLA